MLCFFCFKQKTAYEMRISDWSADVCSSDLDVVIVLVVDAKQVWSALNGPDGLLAGAHPGLVVVIGSTIALDELTQMREVAKAAGVTIVDCGVTSPPGRHARQRIVGLVGAESGVFDRNQEVFDDFTKDATLMSGTGAGMAAK